jgi:hypothetical protein
MTFALIAFVCILCLYIMFEAITSPLRAKTGARAQSFPIHAVSDSESLKNSNDMMQERVTEAGFANNLFYAYARRVSLSPCFPRKR